MNILGYPTAVISRVGKNGGGMFSRTGERDPGILILWTSATTLSNACLWLGTIMSNPGLASIALLSWSSYTKERTWKLDCSPYLSGSCRRVFFERSFQWKWGHKTDKNSIIEHVNKKNENCTNRNKQTVHWLVYTCRVVWTNL